MIIRATAIVLGDNVNTDLLHPPVFFSTDAVQAALGAFAGLGIEPEKVGPAPYVIVGGENFGCGSSRESTVRALKQCGVRAVAARSFAHIFFRNAIALGIWPLVAAGMPDGIEMGAKVSIDTRDWSLTSGRLSVALQPLEQFELQLLEEGGLLPHLKSSDWSWQ